MTEIKLDSDHLSIDTLKRAAQKAGSDGWDTQAAQHLRAVIRVIEAQIQPEPPVVQARDEYAEQMNLELRQSIAAQVLEAMDVDQYLIDAVRAATPPEAQIKPDVPAQPTGDVLLVDCEGRTWFYDGTGWNTNDRWDGGGDSIPWSELSSFGIDKVYRREPSPEAEPKIEMFDYSKTRVTRADLGLSEQEPADSVPVEKVRQVLRSSPAAHHLVDTSTWTAYTDLRQRVAALLPEGAQ